MEHIKNLQKKILTKNYHKKNYPVENILSFFSGSKKLEENQFSDFVKIFEGIFVVFFKNFKLRQIFTERTKHSTNPHDVEKCYRPLEIIFELYYFKKQKIHSEKKGRFYLENIESFSKFSICFFFLSIGCPFFLDGYGEKTKNNNNKIFWGAFLFNVLFFQNKNKITEDSFDLKILLLTNPKKKEIEFSQKFFSLFFRKIKKVFASLESEINIKRFLGFRVIGKAWKLIFSGEDNFLKSGFSEKKNLVKRKNHQSPLLKRATRIMVQKTSGFLRDCSISIKKEALDILVFFLFNFPEYSSYQNYLYKKLTFKIDERKFFSKNTPIDSLFEKEIKREDLEERSSRIIFSPNFFFRKHMGISFFLNRYMLPVKKNSLKKKCLKKKISSSFLSNIKNKKEMFRNIHSRSYIYNLLFRDFKKEEGFFWFEPPSEAFFLIPLQGILRNSFFFRKDKKRFMKTFRSLLVHIKLTNPPLIIILWVSLLINSSSIELKGLNSVFLEISKEKKTDFYLFEDVREKIFEKFSEKNKFQIKILFFITSSVSKTFPVKGITPRKKGLELADKFLFTDKIFLIFWFESFFKKETISKNFEKRNPKIIINHGLLLKLTRGILNSTKKEFYYNFLLRKRLVLLIAEFSLEPIEDFSKIIKIFEKKNQKSKRQKKNNWLLKILFFFQIFNFKKRSKNEELKYKKQSKKPFFEEENKKKKQIVHEVLFKKGKNLNIKLMEIQKLIIFVFEFWDQSGKELKFIFLDSLQFFREVNGENFRELNFLIGFFFHVEHEKGIRLNIAKGLIRLHLISFTNHQKEEIVSFKILTTDESSEILKKEALVILRYFKSGGRKLKKRLIHTEGFSKKKNFSVFILKQKFSYYIYQRKIQKKKSQYWDFIFYILKKKELKEKGFRRVLKRISEIGLSFFWGKTLNSKAITWLKKLNSEFDQKKIILFLAWVLGLNKEFKELEETKLSSLIFNENQIFFQDKIRLSFRKKYL